MDCEHFDRVVLDWLYQELDDIETSASQRHLAHCNRCRNITSHLKASREVGLTPQEPVSDTLIGRVLEAEKAAHAALPLTKRLGRMVSVLAGWTMRPQLAMGALLLLMIGASLVFLRARPSERDLGSLTERGVPEQSPRSGVVLPGVPIDSTHRTEPIAESAQPVAAPTVETKAQEGGAAGAQAKPVVLTDVEAKERFEKAVANFRDGDYSDAKGEFEILAQTTSSVAPHAALFAARSTEQEQGCAVAIARYETISKSTATKMRTLSDEATWLGAECERRLKRWDSARSKYERLRSVPSYGARADQALRALRRAATISPDAGSDSSTEHSVPTVGDTSAQARSGPANQPL